MVSFSTRTQSDTEEEAGLSVGCMDAPSTFITLAMTSVKVTAAGIAQRNRLTAEGMGGVPCQKNQVVGSPYMLDIVSKSEPLVWSYAQDRARREAVLPGRLSSDR